MTLDTSSVFKPLLTSTVMHRHSSMNCFVRSTIGRIKAGASNTGTIGTTYIPHSGRIPTQRCIRQSANMSMTSCLNSSTENNLNKRRYTICKSPARGRKVKRPIGPLYMSTFTDINHRYVTIAVSLCRPS